MKRLEFSAQVLTEAIETAKRDALNRLRDIDHQVAHVRKSILDPTRPLNTLGEFQGMVDKADCRIATLAALRQLRDQCERLLREDADEL